MIVKVQKPLATSEPDPSYLIYNEDQSFRCLVRIGLSDELDEAMEHALTRYFYTSPVPGDPENYHEIDFDRDCPEQDW